MSEVIAALHGTNSIFCQCQLYGIILSREGPHYKIAGTTVQDAITELYYKSGSLRYWRGVRYCSSLTQNRRLDQSIITTILVNGNQISLGMIGKLLLIGQ